MKLRKKIKWIGTVLALAFIAYDAAAQCYQGIYAGTTEIGPCLPGSCFQARWIAPDGTITNFWGGCTNCCTSGRYNWCCLSNADGLMFVNANTNTTTQSGMWVFEVYVIATTTTCTDLYGATGTVVYSKAVLRLAADDPRQCGDYFDFAVVPPINGECHEAGELAATYDPASLFTDSGVQPIGYYWTAEDALTGETYESTNYDGMTSGEISVPSDFPDGSWIAHWGIVYLIGDEEHRFPMGGECIFEYPAGQPGTDIPPGDGDPTQPVIGGDMHNWLQALSDTMSAQIGSAADQISDAIEGQSGVLNTIATNTADTAAGVGQLNEYFTNPDEADIADDYLNPGIPTSSLQWADVLAVPELPTGGQPITWTVPIPTGAIGGQDYDFVLDIRDLDVAHRSLIHGILSFAGYVMFMIRVMVLFAGQGIGDG